MAHLRHKIEIEAERNAVWAALAALEDVAAWNPNVAATSCDQLGPVEVGTARTCFLAQGGRIDEVVSVWKPATMLQFAIGSHGAVRSADMAMELSDSPIGTTVVATADYHVAFGPLGPVIDRIAMRRQMARILDSSLLGLKEHVETKNRNENERNCHE